jgi:NifU-like protein
MLDDASNSGTGVLAPQPPRRVAAARPPASLRPQAPSTQAPSTQGPPTSDTLEGIALIAKAIEDLRPYLQRDGGDCELVDVEGNTIYVKLKGACVGCHMASVTIAGVQGRLMEKLGVPLRVIPVG